MLAKQMVGDPGTIHKTLDRQVLHQCGLQEHNPVLVQPTLLPHPSRLLNLGFPMLGNLTILPVAFTGPEPWLTPPPLGNYPWWLCAR